ncbi:MAG: tRNA dihydrouridine synthase DusB [Sinobacterium sp.]|nr:tRNA dihydrouridine synthase DusB [Sinobacterium sp.]
MISIGSHTLCSNVLLAPMAGVTDVPFRQVCQQYGAGLTTSEMLIADTKQWKTRKSSQRLQTVSSKESSSVPNSIQIVGYDADMLANAALAAVHEGAEIIDINMGCPAKKVCKKAAGSALLKDEVLVASILNSVSTALKPHSIPLTLKIRTGWDEAQKNASTIARIAEDAGVAAIAIHGRTRAMRFNGEAEFDTIATVKQEVSIPVIANGDIDTVEKALHILSSTQVDGIMVGRGAQGRPWLIQQIQQAIMGQVVTEPSMQEKTKTLIDHVHALHAFYGDFLGLRIARKHVAWYLQNMHFSRSVSKAFNGIDEQEKQIEFLKLLLCKSVSTH